MRVTAETKAATRVRILEAASGLFRNEGFEQTTVRDIATSAGIASGTLFNYFPSKEAVALELMRDALARAETKFAKRVRPQSSLEEDLFLYVSTGLRQLKPLRTFLGPTLDACLGPASGDDDEDPGARIRTAHLESVAGILRRHEVQEPLSAVQSQMYWLLYTGVLSFWARDASPKQEDTLALLDQSIHMFVNWIASEAPARGAKS